jgi:hypothetical protein
MADPSVLKARRKALLTEMRHARVAILQGTIVESFTTCGHPRCRCAKGEKHGPNYYLSTKEERRTQMLYIPRGRLEEVRTAVENYRKLKEALSEIVSINRELFRLGEEVK